MNANFDNEKNDCKVRNVVLNDLGARGSSNFRRFLTFCLDARHYTFIGRVYSREVSEPLIGPKANPGIYCTRAPMHHMTHFFLLLIGGCRTMTIIFARSEALGREGFPPGARCPHWLTSDPVTLDISIYQTCRSLKCYRC